jgi:hypothetical protein
MIKLRIYTHSQKHHISLKNLMISSPKTSVITVAIKSLSSMHSFTINSLIAVVKGF